MTCAEQLAEFVSRASFDDISNAACLQLKIRVLDAQGIGIAFALASFFCVTTALLLGSSLVAMIALRICAQPEKAAKTKDIQSSFPFFVRSVYVWLLIAGVLGIWAANTTDPAGIWGAARHALTVGFVAMMVFCIGQRVLPAFSGMRLLFSPRLMLVGLLFLPLGRAVRVLVFTTVTHTIVRNHRLGWGGHAISGQPRTE